MPLKARSPNHVCTYDFVHDSTADGRPLKILTVVDEFTRELKGIAVEPRMLASRVIEELDALFAAEGAPEYLRSAEGPEFGRGRRARGFLSAARRPGT